MKNEKTSARVARSASTLTKRLDKVCTGLSKLLLDLEDLVDDVASVSMSALTQAPDKKK
jgi:ABC-type transporter Mla subunit MlaD